MHPGTPSEFFTDPSSSIRCQFLWVLGILAQAVAAISAADRHPAAPGHSEASACPAIHQCNSQDPAEQAPPPAF